ncbi:MAG: MurR/RpiR family transcriptional regulator [Gammaproteobacteria bacterium]|nr:MurR/RpiR family transcriptional regulator [Gammaproteobacteria bacterium]MDH3758295.1 MurR/RpiR family transcriptional regulator [Gammaproteobacteria bacterium]
MNTRYPDTVRLLTESFSGLTPELQKAAKYMLENPEEVGLNSMRTVARGAGVKPATVSRLSKTLGFDGYDGLREPFRERLRKNEPKFASKLRDVQRRSLGDTEGLFSELREQEVANVEVTLSDENYATLAAAAETLHRSRRVYVLGLRGAYAPAFLFHYAYQLFQENSHLVDTHAGIFADQLRGIGEKDSLLVISFPPYTQLTIDAVEYAAAAGANIVAVTDSVVSPAAHAAGHTIVTQNRSASFYHSFTGALAVMQALITLLVAKKGGDAIAIVQEAENQLSRISAYW